VGLKPCAATREGATQLQEPAAQVKGRGTTWPPGGGGTQVGVPTNRGVGAAHPACSKQATSPLQQGKCTQVGVPTNRGLGAAHPACSKQATSPLQQGKCHTGLRPCQAAKCIKAEHQRAPAAASTSSSHSHLLDVGHEVVGDAHWVLTQLSAWVRSHWVEVPGAGHWAGGVLWQGTAQQKAIIGARSGQHARCRAHSLAGHAHIEADRGERTLT